MAARALTQQTEVAYDPEVTIERRVRVPATDRDAISSRETTRMGIIDARLLAIARGEIEPDDVLDLLIAEDPFGGLIPIYDDDAEEIDDDWLIEEPDERDVPAAIAHAAVPRICMRAAEILALPLDHRTGFTLSHIDGVRTIEELIDVSHLNMADTLDVLATLVELGAIAIE